MTFFYLDIFFQNLHFRGITRYHLGDNPIRSVDGDIMITSSVVCRINDCNNEAKERKFIVFESELDTLFFHCDKCCTCTTIKQSNIGKKVIGTMLQVTANCECGDIRVWHSQPMSNTMPPGNLILASAILFSDSNPCKVLNLMRHAGVQFFSKRTFNYMQTAYVVPVINSVWEVKQLDLLTSIREAGQDLKLGRDARCCSPGHTAKYGSYSVMDLSTSEIVDI